MARQRKKATSGASATEPAAKCQPIGMFITRIRAPPYVRQRVRHRSVSQTPATYSGPIPVLQGSGDADLRCNRPGAAVSQGVLDEFWL